jgi:hypothetical protein
MSVHRRLPLTGRQAKILGMWYDCLGPSEIARRLSEIRPGVMGNKRVTPQSVCRSIKHALARLERNGITPPRRKNIRRVRCHQLSIDPGT